MAGRRRLSQGVVTLVVLATLFLPASTAVAAGSSKLSPGARYVAIGSSYAAGFGIRQQEPGSSACGRSEVDYPHLVAAKLRLQLDDVSCGGAVTANALDTPQGSAPPQIDAVTPVTRLVTLTIGGNDVDYIGTAIACGQPHSTCTATADPAQTDDAFRALPGSLTELIHAIRSKAPSATILLVTYPRLVPPAACPALHYTQAATRLVGSMGQRLEQVFVTVAKADHLRVVDPYVLGAAHGPCATGTAKWVAGLVATNGFEYHPTASGHQEMAHLVEQALSRS
jgi:lysophospholipase L1-like esterase